MVPIDEETALRYVDPYALTKDILERMGQMYARRGMQVTALRFHWILTPDEVRRYIAEAPPEDNRRNLWGYVDLAEAARACVLSLQPRTSRRTLRDPGDRRRGHRHGAADRRPARPLLTGHRGHRGPLRHHSRSSTAAVPPR